MPSWTSVALCTLLAGLGAATEIRVRAGQSIQAAINKARPGDAIFVARGTYAEQLLVNKSGIALIGQWGATLVPPATPVNNGCTGLALPQAGVAGQNPNTQAGICILGAGVVLQQRPEENDHKKVVRFGAPVQNVVVEGFTVRGFSGLNVAVVNARNTAVRGNALVDGGRYGMLTVGSALTLASRNLVTSSTLGYIGVCMDDRSDVRVSGNSINNMVIALCVQTDGADVSANSVSNSCVGAYVDPFVRGASLTNNRIGPTNKACTFGFSSGIRIAGAVGTRVQYNTIYGQTDFGVPDGRGPGQSYGAGVAIYDDVEKKAKAAGNVVRFNSLYRNDIDVDRYYTGQNTIQGNACTTPRDLCTRQ